jgi:hypothetical protein
MTSEWSPNTCFCPSMNSLYGSVRGVGYTITDPLPPSSFLPRPPPQRTHIWISKELSCALRDRIRLQITSVCLRTLAMICQKDPGTYKGQKKKLDSLSLFFFCVFLSFRITFIEKWHQNERRTRVFVPSMNSLYGSVRGVPEYTRTDPLPPLPFFPVPPLLQTDVICRRCDPEEHTTILCWFICVFLGGGGRENGVNLWTLAIICQKGPPHGPAHTNGKRKKLDSLSLFFFCVFPSFRITFIEKWPQNDLPNTCLSSTLSLSLSMAQSITGFLSTFQKSKILFRN